MEISQMKEDSKSEKTFFTELAEKFFSMPYGSISKADLQEFILYLFDKYSEKKILSLPDTELEVFLKISRSRVQTVRNNINLKYSKTYQFTDENLLDNLMNLSSNSFHFSDNMVLLIIDNPIVRDHLEYVMREKLSLAFDYKANRTIVEMKYEHFLKCIEELLNNTKKSDYKGLNEKLKNLKNEHRKIFAKSAASFAVDKAATLIGTLTGILGVLK